MFRSTSYAIAGVVMLESRDEKSPEKMCLFEK